MATQHRRGRRRPLRSLFRRATGRSPSVSADPSEARRQRRRSARSDPSGRLGRRPIGWPEALRGFLLLACFPARPSPRRSAWPRPRHLDVGAPFTMITPARKGVCYGKVCGLMALIHLSLDSAASCLRVTSLGGRGLAASSPEVRWPRTTRGPLQSPPPHLVRRLAPTAAAPGTQPHEPVHCVALIPNRWTPAAAPGHCRVRRKGLGARR
jgi:hypothetical protein